MYYIYFLKLKNKDIYVGSTNNLKRRMLEHQTGKVKTTKLYLPIKLLSYIVLPTNNQARNLEKYFKTGSGKAVLKKRILADEANISER